jgi:hypothetical protein
MILGILGLCTFAYAIGPLLAVILGHVALSNVNKSGGALAGRGMALAGLIMGYIGLALFVLYLIGSNSH